MTRTRRVRQSAPVRIGDVRVMAGGKHLYDTFVSDGRLSTQSTLFATDGAVVKAESTLTLKAIAAMLSAHSALRLAIEGHSDDVGDATANMALSERRARAVTTVLVERFNVDQSRLSARGFGATRPVRPNTTAESRHENRRVDLVRL